MENVEKGGPVGTEGVTQRWRELCRWDPALPPESEPVQADALVGALVAAFERPQPLGWGLDPAVEPVARAFAVEVGDVDAALAQLVCLHEAFEQMVIAPMPPDQHEEAHHRLTMLIHRTMIFAGRVAADHLVEEALTDPLTGIQNRRAFDLDLQRELSRARRHGRPLTVALIDVDGLKAVNDRFGHRAGDEALRAVARALESTARREDGAYRIGGDEFALLLVDAVIAEEDVLLHRLREAGAPPCSIGVATMDGDSELDLVTAADRRLYELRGRRRAEARSGG